ncbi:DNA translocase FtsK [Fulvitalea axinellae]|uniref:DNA translocase FtsK n=1 Tax=Fulvitalea axinellae TaxID=1182444 RepID=A0AAU9CDQ0_9BACT|nr:DNA translocase FtsK [Fulvitalea axinellae]
MAKNSFKSNNSKTGERRRKTTKRFSIQFFKDPKFKISAGLFLIIASVFLFVAFLSFLFTGHADQSVLEGVPGTGLRQSSREVSNWLGLLGAWASYSFIYKWFGVASFFFPPILFLVGVKIVFDKTLLPLGRAAKLSIFALVWFCVFFGYFNLRTETPWMGMSYLSGGFGFELASLLDGFLGWGTLLLWLFVLAIFVVYFFGVDSLKFLWPEGKKKEKKQEKATTTEDTVPTNRIREKEPEPVPVIEKERETTAVTDTEEDPDIAGIELKTESPKPVMMQPEKELVVTEPEPIKVEEWAVDTKAVKANARSAKKEKDATPLEMAVEDTTKLAETLTPKEAAKIAQVRDKLGDEIEEYDPTLELGSFQFPSLDLLIDRPHKKGQVSNEELEMHKNRIVETLVNFKIGISSIKATIGPTVTLYEIVPEAGVKISKIKNLEDDIALSLSALGIRIIAPIPGKGTIGIEVPNKVKEVVSIRSVLSTKKFLDSGKELPFAIGKTISNEVYVADLAKMPHLLMAGATGQGKSVGLNVLLASLLYKKHPAELKFVMVDPKKVELTLYNKIERHYLAKLPDSEEAIITDTKKVINTLNSLCIEMDNRYDLLKDAGCRNLKEYNGKFKGRRLNPEKGHRYLPYIVVVIDELADLMMTAGKEIESPIARLAQLARAIGIHLVLATQRPSVNVITGVIKANFPARMSFRVTSKIDSRTILDCGGAEQLIGKGDMLVSDGNEVVRLQCAFIDTPEVEEICEFVGEQQGYASAYVLPEYVGEDPDGGSLADLSERDSMFEEAARVLVMHQQGSTSLLQRKLKLGYNRAGRIVDQLEAAGIVGPFEGSKAREVLVKDEYSLEQLLNALNEK